LLFLRSIATSNPGLGRWHLSYWSAAKYLSAGMRYSFYFCPLVLSYEF